LAICTIGGSPLAAGTSDSFVGAFWDSYYTTVTNAGGKNLKVWIDGVHEITLYNLASPAILSGDNGFGSSFIIYEIVD
jgi:hypothetical protein